MQLLVAVIRFLTRIPIPGAEKVFPQEEFAKGIIFFPLAALLTGFLNAAVYIVFSQTVPGYTASLMAVLCNFAVTGAFHLDGLADTCDAIFSARKKEDMLRIMRDSRLGTYAAVAVSMDILLRFALTMNFFSVKETAVSVFLAPLAGKLAAPVLVNSRYARGNIAGLGCAFIEITPEKYRWASLLISVFLFFLLMGKRAVPVTAVLLLFAYLFRQKMEKTVGGMTGDTLGAGIEMAELLFFMTDAFLYRWW